VERWADEEEPPSRLEIDIDRRRLAFLATLLLLAGLACLATYPRWSRPWLVGWPALACVPWLHRRRKDPRPLLVLDRMGLHAPRSGLGVVAWGDVRRVRLRGIGRTTFLCLRVDRMQEYLARVPRWRAWLMVLSLARFGDELRVELGLADASPSEIFAEVSRRCEAFAMSGHGRSEGLH
jgi:hypothetical protein